MAANDTNDAALWRAYWDATSEAKKQRLAGEIVNVHMGFLIHYARKTAFKSWSEETFEDYLSELVIVALGRVPHYRDDVDAKFVSFLSPYLQPVKYRIMGTLQPFQIGCETARITLATDAMVQDGVTDPATIAATVSKVHGKRIGVGRIERVLSRFTVVSGDAPAKRPGDPGGDLWAVMDAPGTSIEDEVVERAERAELQVEVAARLAAAGLTDLERAIVIERLMRRGQTAPEPVSDSVLAARFGVSKQWVTKLERKLVERLRDLLADLAP